jgi:predicted small lipoprotein YifL
MKTMIRKINEGIFAKRRFLALLIAAVFVSMSLTACGNKAAETNGDAESTETSEESEEETKETKEANKETKEAVDKTKEASSETQTSSVEEETTRATLDEDIPVVSDIYTLEFPEAVVGSGYTEKCVLENDSSISINYTHYEDSEYNLTVDFYWEGPTTLGEAAYTAAASTYNGLHLIDSKDWVYSLHYWYGGTLVNEEDYMKNISKEAILNCTKAEPSSNDYYDVYEDETMYRVIFSVYGDDYKGYDCYIDDYKTNTCYQFEYLEKNSVYDDAHALALVESIVTNPNVDN